MAEANSLPLRILTYAIALFWGAVIFGNSIYLMVKTGPTKFFSKKKRTTRPLCLDEGSLGTHSFVRLKNIRMHYVVSGPESRPLMLFIHGFPEFWYSWRHQIRAFNKDYRCVAIDMRGYGETEKPKGMENYTVDLLAEDIKEIVDALGYEKCTVVAHDWGGIVAQVFTMLYPKMVQRLVICNVPHPAAMRKYLRSSIKQFLMSWYVTFFQLPWFPEFFLGTTDYAFLKEALKDAATEDDIEAYKWSIAQPGGLTGPINYYRASLQYKPLDLPRTPITVPTLYVWGEKDKFLSKEMASMSAAYYKDFTLNFIEHAGHFVQMEVGDETNECISNFLQRKKF